MTPVWPLTPTQTVNTLYESLVGVLLTKSGDYTMETVGEAF